MTRVAKGTVIEVRQEIDRVVLQIGSTEIGLTYEQALKMGEWLMFRGKQAKLTAGDFSSNMSHIADLSTVEENYERFVKPNNRFTTPNNPIGGGK
jgi:hypothetical protein